MKNRRTVITALCMVVVFLLTACAAPSADVSVSPSASLSSSSLSTGDSGNTDEAISFTDIAGRRIELEKRPEKIIVANYIVNYMLVGGKESLDKVVGMTLDGWEDTRYGEYTVFTQSFPEMKEIPSIGGYHDNILNAEKIISLQPDVILMSESQFTENSNVIDTFEKAGIAVVVLDYHDMKQENHTKSTEILGMLLGREEIAKEQIDAYTNAIEDVNARIAALPDEEKEKTVYVELGNKGPGEYGNSYNNTMLWGAIVNNLGAKNLAADLDAIGPLDQEFVLSSNPDIIIIAGSVWSDDSNGDHMHMGFTVDEETALARLKGFADRTQWAQLDAVKNGNIYAVDHGSLRNIADYMFTEYLAKIIYPEEFEDLDPVKEMNEFYAKYLPELGYTGTFMLELG